VFHHTDKPAHTHIGHPNIFEARQNGNPLFGTANLATAKKYLELIGARFPLAITFKAKTTKQWQEKHRLP
jgi:hypothetical protein